MAKFYDPITECWFDMPEKSKPAQVFVPPEGIYERHARITRESRIWEAIVSTATATQTATQCPDGSESAASES